ncbi:ABC transporter substrate-binding protein [Paramicrobacterium agarici]|uniref:Carbohydrate ABC transporter substrate-binding protein (CUT1 family) n=1 Tax=Paramicrobacterium agarici TaxID=630514 RepID=A0A2A9E0Z9_9MICO|nr:sugar ABC transporter substrate-binding protein [Microbacterium agarici]PFG31869.1 carbohydrate ABC transporter substrate-binding protein (CUT1 family) [Microbacterium agarici]TQO21765.1 carbohydrate ABC transporter substrate-binding protein (CUT1 family) [Microbacterium agarici]
MKRRHLVALTTSAMVVAAGLTACSTGQEAKDGPATITILEYQQARADVLEELIPEFEKAMSAKGKDITVKLNADILPDSDVNTKLTQQLHAGTAPDVIDTGGSNITGWAAAGYLLELDDYLTDWDGWDTFYDVSRVRAKQSDGHYYSIPHEASLQHLFVRADVLDDLGIDTSQPETWDELIERLTAVKDQTGEAPIVIPAGTAWGDGSFTEGFLPIAAGTGSPFYNAEDGTWTIESKGLTATFELYNELVKEQLLPVEALLNPNPWEPTKYEAFPAGTMPVAAQGTWGWRYDWGPDGSAPIEDVQDKVITWNYPALVDGTEPYSVSGGGYNYAVNAESEYPDAAVEFIKWLASDEALAKQLAVVGAASPREGISDIEPYASEPALLDAESKLTTAVVPLVGEGSDQISQAVQHATAQILTGDANGKQAAKAFAKEVREFLDPSFIAE